VGRVTAAVPLALLALLGCRQPAAPPAQPAQPAVERRAPAPAAPERLRVRVVATYPHDTGAYTQGLLWHDGTLYESTGQYGESTVRQVELATGRVLRQAELPRQYFGEGLALVGSRLVQLTWQEGVALIWGLADVAPRGEHRYTGEGWGLCYDGRRLVMSDGSARLTFRDPESFAVIGGVDVTLSGVPADRLNELECVEGAVYANVWRDQEIFRIDPGDGRVTAVINASGLISAKERLLADVLNGIAYRPETETFFITGKLWPKLFEVVFEANNQDN
jgi:glutaminyl-peptide cyclotransferase